MGPIMSLAMDRRGVQVDSKNIDNSRVMIQFKFPLNEIVVDFYDALKSLSSGYASFDYEENGFESSDIVKVFSQCILSSIVFFFFQVVIDRFAALLIVTLRIFSLQLHIMLNGEIVEELSTVVHASKARQYGKVICLRLKETIPKQLFQVAIQAAVGGKILAVSY